MGNRVSGMLAPLPLTERDPWRRLQVMVETTRDLKDSGQTGAVELFGQAVDLLPNQVLSPFFRRASRTTALDQGRAVDGDPIISARTAALKRCRVSSDGLVATLR